MRLLKALFSINPASLTLGTILVVVVLFFFGTPIFDLVELKTYDLRFQSRGHVPPSPAVVMAVIDEKNLDVEGRWPWPRSKIAASDLQGFTSTSERYTPHEMIELLSEYYARMTEQIFASEGMLKEYVGDELMAIFGAPLAQPDHAERACAAALAMREHRNALREEWAKIGRPPLIARTGINSGPMLVGNLGSKYRFAYGVLGDHVNLGSRLEGLNKAYGTGIRIGENTAQLVEKSFVLREIDLVRVVGREQAVRISELLATAGTPLPKLQEQALSCYAAGLEAYRQQRWDEALGLFKESLALWPADGPSRIMAERCQSYQKAPPPEEWEGVFETLYK